MSWGECHLTPVMKSEHWLGYQAITWTNVDQWHHMASLGCNELNCIWCFAHPFSEVLQSHAGPESYNKRQSHGGRGCCFRWQWRGEWRPEEVIRWVLQQWSYHSLMQGSPFLKIITCPTPRILKFFDLHISNKEEKSVQIHLPDW